MSTEAEIVEFEGRRYRVAGKSGPGVEPKVGMVVRYAKALYSITHFRADGSFALECAGRLTSFLESPGYGGLWANHACEILVPIEASPLAETPRCEAPGWCGRAYEDPRVPIGFSRFRPCSPHPGSLTLCKAKDCSHPTYCSTACADRARAAAPRTSNRPSGEGASAGDAAATNDPCKGQTGDPSPGDSSASPASVAHPPCLSHHPELGSRCEMRYAHVTHEGRKPASAERVFWVDPAKHETREERWRRTHPGYGDAPSRKGADRDWDIRLFMVNKGKTANVPGSDFLSATNRKLAPWAPSDPEADIPWVWER